MPTRLCALAMMAVIAGACLVTRPALSDEQTEDRIIYQGMAQAFANGVANEKVDAGTLSYMAPECLGKSMAETTPAIDVWAIGIMFFAMTFGYLPFSHESEKELVRMIRCDAVKFPKHIPITPEGKQVIESMLQKDPAKRLQLIDFVQTPYALYEDEEFDEKLQETEKHFE